MTSNSSVRTPEPGPNLASLIEQAIKGPSFNSAPIEDAPEEDAVTAAGETAAPAGVLPERLIEELHAAREQMMADAPPPEPPLTGAALIATLTAVFAADRPPVAVAGAMPGGAVLGTVKPPGRARAAASDAAGGQDPVGFSAWFRPRYLALLSFFHWYVFDQRIERRLFFKTPAPGARLKTNARGQAKFLYSGPVPSAVLGWALSALPADLQQFAFVDFEAGNGRALLLAARRNFEHATGYTHDGEACAALEMNLSKYARSHMSCRDVRALRGDRDGLPMPAQAAVLFFPDSLSRAVLEAAFARLAASLKLAPRPVYLIFENSGPEEGRGEMKLFTSIRLPFLSRIKVALFSPGRIAVYKFVQPEPPAS
jgi:hypothetical protein